MGRSLFSKYGNHIDHKEGEGDRFEYSLFKGGRHIVKTIIGPRLIATIPMFNTGRSLLYADLEKQVLDLMGKRPFFICTRGGTDGRRYEVYDLSEVQS